MSTTKRNKKLARKTREGKGGDPVTVSNETLVKKHGFNSRSFKRR